MINRIIVGLDGSKYSFTAADYGIYLSKKLKRPVVAVNVMDLRLINEALIEDFAGILGFTEYMNLTEKIKEYLDKKGEAILRAFAVKCRQEGADCSIVQILGIVADELVSLTDPDDLLIIGKKGLNENLLPLHIGSTTDAVVKKSKAPVLAVEKEFREPKRIAICFDGRETSVKAVEYINYLYKYLDIEKIIVVSVVNSKFPPKIIKEKLISVAKFDYELEFLEGYPEEELERYLNGHTDDIDLAVIGAFGESRIKELFLGSTTLYLLHKLKLPILIVK
jgi:nucleotide-binding universal stress UspA family protein